MKDIIERFRDVVIQIATPYSTGTGFYLKNPGLIVTNEHIVRDNREVVISGSQLKKQMVRVLYIDEKYDLAFLEAPESLELPEVKLAETREVAQGDAIIAIGHPFGLKYTTTQGIISNTMHKVGDLFYLQHDAALNPGNSGGPLVDKGGDVVGVNTFIIKDGDNTGFSLPVKYIAQTIQEYHHADGAIGARCHSCSNIVGENQIENGYCPVCGAKLLLPSRVDEYEPVGVAKTIESMLEEIGHDVHLSRRGPNAWEIIEGSAKITISYYEGLITGDAYLCRLPKENIQPLYEYLLHQNYEMEGLTFSVRGQDIILSLLIYDRYLNTETGVRLFKHLFKKADDIDNILVEEYGALWNPED